MKGTRTCKSTLALAPSRQRKQSTPRLAGHSPDLQAEVVGIVQLAGILDQQSVIQQLTRLALLRKRLDTQLESMIVTGGGS